jgi:hypothetical protein
MTVTSTAYESWLKEVEEALASINMPMDEWQKIWAFDFRHEFETQVAARDAAMKASQAWWRQQNKAIGQDCRKTLNCWLPRGHQGECQPLFEHGGTKVGKYKRGDHVKFEVMNERTGEKEWMWLLVERCDDHKRLVFGQLDSEPIVITDMRLGEELAVSYDNVREHRRFE